MVCYYLFYILIVFLQSHYSLEFIASYEPYTMNVDCRDNDDMPVDCAPVRDAPALCIVPAEQNYNLTNKWWYIYKPPKKTGRYFNSGGNFTFVTSTQPGRLQPSRTFLNHDSMLQFTLAPLYEKQLKNSIAVMSYGERFYPSSGADIRASTALGILIANSFGGIWVTHTIPDFPDLTMAGPSVITEKDSKKGHMIMCLSLSLEAMNAIAEAVKHTESKITKLSLPDNLSLSLPEWTRMTTDIKASKTNTSSKTKFVSISTRSKNLKLKILARGPDDSRGLYNTFAKFQGVVLDIYNSHNDYPKPVCETAYSLRYIHKISLNFPDHQVCYIRREDDRMSFAVSTAAYWQRKSRKSHHPWTCTGNHEQQGYMMKGGIIICVNDFSVWFGFDNLKTKEPEC